MKSSKGRAENIRASCKAVRKLEPRTKGKREKAAVEQQYLQ